MDTEAPMSTKALKKKRKEKPILVLDILVLVICSRCPPRRSVCWFLRWDYFDSLTMDSHATHPREFNMWATVLHRIYLSHLSFLTDLPEELLSNQHSSFVLTHSGSLHSRLCHCSTSAYRCLGFFCTVCISGKWDRLLIILLSSCDCGPHCLTPCTLPLITPCSLVGSL